MTDCVAADVSSGIDRLRVTLGCRSGEGDPAHARYLAWT
jgi:hypothetical protein